MNDLVELIRLMKRQTCCKKEPFKYYGGLKGEERLFVICRGCGSFLSINIGHLKKDELDLFLKHFTVPARQINIFEMKGDMD